MEECLEELPETSEEARLDLEREACEMTVGGEGGGTDPASEARRDSSRLLAWLGVRAENWSGDDCCGDDEC